MRLKREDRLVIIFNTGESIEFTDGIIISTYCDGLSAREEVPREVAEEIISLLEDWLAEGKLK